VTQAAHLRDGALAEKIAARHLRESGLKLIESNFRCRSGELDLILASPERLVVAEVRYRRSRSYGGPLATVTAAKQQRIVRATQLFLQAKPEYRSLPVRFDVVAVSGSLDSDPGAPDIEWIQGAFSAGAPF